jgi:type IV secretory pathway VirB6-like protein
MNMAHFEVAVTRRTEPADGLPIVRRRRVLGRFGAVLASIAAALLAVVVVVTALLLGYFIAGLVIAAMLVAILVALLRTAFRALRS